MTANDRKGGGVNLLNNEHGAALIIVLVMLLLLTILGTTLLTSSTTDLQIAGNYRNSQEAFYVADAAVEYLQTGRLPGGQNIYANKIIPGVQNSYSSTVVIGGRTASYRVEYIGSGPPPLGKGYDDSFQSNFYSIETRGSAAGQTAAEVDSEIAIISPKAKNY